MTDDDLKRAYQARVRALGPHPEPEVLAALAERRLPEAERLAVLDHLAQCVGCRADFDLLDSIAAAHRTDRTVAAGAPRWLPLAAAVVLSLGGLAWWQFRASGEDPQVRSGEADIGLIEPKDSVQASGAPVQFVWHAVAGATSYRLEVVHVDGRLAFAADVPDTVAGLAASGPLAPGAYRWWVAATTPSGDRQSAAKPLVIR